MIDVPYNPDRSEYLAPHGDDYLPCLICGRLCNLNAVDTAMVHLHGGGSIIVFDFEAVQMDVAADLGFKPIGPDCWSLHPELHPYRDGGPHTIYQDIPHKLVFDPAFPEALRRAWQVGQGWEKWEDRRQGIAKTRSVSWEPATAGTGVRYTLAVLDDVLRFYVTYSNQAGFVTGVDRMLLAYVYYPSAGAAYWRFIPIYGFENQCTSPAHYLVTHGAGL